MPKRLIGPALIDELQRKTKPAKEVQYRDRECPGFHIRHLTTGRIVYAVRFARSGPGAAVTLGPVAQWTDTVHPVDHPKHRHGSEVARQHARELLTAYHRGEPVNVKRPDAASSTDLTLLAAFGLRACANGGLAIVGLYRRPKKSQVGVAFDSFVEFVGRTRAVSTVSRDDVQKWTDALAESVVPKTGLPMTRNSVARYMSDVRTAFHWAVAQKLVDVNPFIGFRLPKAERKVDDKSKKTRWLRPDEETRLLAALAARDIAMRATGRRQQKTREVGCRYIDHLTPIVLTALHTGGRRGAIFNLRWRHIGPLDGGVRLLEYEGKFQKCGQTYFVPLNSAILDVLNAWRPKNAAPSDLVFPSTRGKVLRNIDGAWRSIRELADLVDFRFHDLRHTFASKLAQRREPQFSISKLMGHATPTMTNRYSHLDPGNAVNAVESLLAPVSADALALPPHLAALIERLVEERTKAQLTAQQNAA